MLILSLIHISLGFEGCDYSQIAEYCKSLGVRYTVVDTAIGEIIFNQRKEDNPCSLCAKMRKGALNNAAEELGCNKVALGHNKDDVIETFIMTLIYEDVYKRQPSGPGVWALKYFDIYSGLMSGIISVLSEMYFSCGLSFKIDF